MKTLTFSALLGLTLVLASQAQPASRRPPDSGRAAFTGTMPPGDGGPRNHRILLAFSKDGLAWTVAAESLAEQASVPELFEGPDGKLISIFVDASGQSLRGTLGAMVRGDDGKWKRAETNFRGADPNIVRIKDGTYRGYTKDREGAIIVFSSRDGLQWERSGVAFQDERYRQSTDSDVFETADGWVALISLGPRMLRCTSSDGLTFTTDGTILDLGGSVSDTVKVEGGWRTFFHVNANPRTGGKMLIRSAFTQDGRTWKVEEGDRVAAPTSGPASLGVADPAPVQLKDGTWLMAVKSFIESPKRGGQPQFGQNTDGPPAIRSRNSASRPPSNPANDFEPPVGADPKAHREAPGSFRLMSARSRDGLTFVPTGEIISDQANVPDLIHNDRGEIHLYYTGGQVGDRYNTAGLAISRDQGKTWTFKHVEVPGFERAGDPDIVRLPDGIWRMFLTTRVNNNIGIIYADSRDGIRFEHRGTAFSKPGLDLLDSTTFQIGSTWHTLTLEGREVRQRHGTSPDATTFAVGEVMPFVADGEPFIAANGVKADGGYRLYGFSPFPPGKLGFRSFFSKDGAQWTAEPGVRLAFDKVSSGGGTQIKDPSVLKLADGSYLMVYTARIPETRGENVSNATRTSRAGGPPANSFADAPQPRREPSGQRGPGGQIRVEKIDSKYKTAPGAKPGSFVTGQDADIVLGSKGFNNSGGAQLFNHPTGLATDGKALLMTDRWNNRVLIWKSAPAKNTPPDLVLGQPDFTQNNPGTGKHQMNWPGNVAITPDGNGIAVTDTDNDRILIWNSFPTKNGQPADLVLDLPQLSGGAPASGPAGPGNDGERRFPNRPGTESPRNDGPRADAPERRASLGQNDPAPSGRAMRGAPNANFRPQVGRGIQRFGWPWGVWTDGIKLAVVATHGHAVLIWNSLPTRDNQPPDLVLDPSDAGTPRNITSDGKTFFAVSDHNNGEQSRPATMVWNSFPTSSSQQPDWKWSEWVKGSFTPDGKLVVGGMQSVYLWNKTPRNAETDADVVLRPTTYRNGDGPDAVVANGRLYVCTYNGNHILGWTALPTSDNQPADFALGSDRTDQNTWAENFFIQNAVVATDGKSLFITSDFDRKMFVWKKLPDESAAKPDLVMHLPEGPWDNELHGSTLALAGRSSVSIWKKLPLNGEQPDIELRRRIGSVELGELTGVAFDDKYFYLSDRRAECIYVWEGIPTSDREPKFTFPMRSPGRLSSDGNYLCAAPFEGGSIQLWRVSELNSRAEPITLGGRGQFNLPSEGLIADGRLFVANRSFNRVDVWDRVEDALAGQPADALLGATDEQDRKPAIGRNQLSMPGSLAWGGGYLWVGEFKFSTRILRFSPRAKQSAAAN